MGRSLLIHDRIPLAEIAPPAGYSGPLNYVMLFMLLYRDTRQRQNQNHGSITHEQPMAGSHDLLQWLASDWIVLRTPSDARQCHHTREAVIRLSRYDPGSNLHSQLNKQRHIHADSATRYSLRTLFLQGLRLRSNKCVF